MPAPGSSFIATDALFYRYLYEPLSSYICFLNPNWITIACFLMLFPIIYAIHVDASIWLLLGLMFVRQSLDCLDGAVARSCNKQTDFGAFLDLTEDTATVVLLGGYIAWLAWNSSHWIKWPFIAGWLFACFKYIMVNISWDHMNTWEHIIHDNTVLITLGIAAFAYWIKRS
jgi:phosphatidylserine synthase